MHIIFIDFLILKSDENFGWSPVRRANVKNGHVLLGEESRDFPAMAMNIRGYGDFVLHYLPWLNIIKHVLPWFNHV